LKKHGPGHLIEAIEAAFQNRIHLNPSLIVRMPRTLTPRLLVDQLKLFREADDPEKSRAEQVVEDLFRRLFYKASAVEFLRASPGYGPCTVVMVRPFFEGDEGVEL